LRTRVALITGTVLAVVACCVGCFVPTIFHPDHPYDVDEKELYDNVVPWLALAGGVLGIVACVLLIVGWVWYEDARKRAMRR
jgi:hypothetical protein